MGQSVARFRVPFGGLQQVATLRELLGTELTPKAKHTSRVSRIADEKCEPLDEERPPRYRDILGAFNIQYHAPCDIGTIGHMSRVFGTLRPMTHGACNSEFALQL